MTRPTVVIDPQPRFEMSPGLYMQFMEPLGATDGSVDAAWDWRRQDWRDDLVAATRELSPSMMRYGGCLSSYYRWREGVGPRTRRRPMCNQMWGGMESNQVGTHEFVDFCRRVGAEPFFCVNFESDGRQGWARPPHGGVRSAGPAEAAAWVDYCNNPDNPRRIANGAREPFNLKLWQIGNETSYRYGDNPSGPGFDCETAARRTVAFAKAMHKADPEIRLIGWGDSGWAPRMLEIAGEHLQMIAFHHMFNPAWVDKDTPLKNNDWRRDPDRTWEALMQVWRQQDSMIVRMREQTGNHAVDLALTESHFAIPGRNRCELLSTWAAGVANARILHVHERHGDRLKIATLADFCGTAWQVNAVMIDRNTSYLMPVAQVMALYRRHSGERALEVSSTPEGLDITASRTENTVFLHVVNTNRTRSVQADLNVSGCAIRALRGHEIAVPPETEIMSHNAALLVPVQKTAPPGRPWTFPSASVTALELELSNASTR